MLDQAAVHVDETGWRTRGEGRALWTATTPGAIFLQIAEHCNREQFNTLIGTAYPGIVISDRWNGYEPSATQSRRQVCWSHIQRDFRRHADGLAEQKTFGEQGLQLTRQVFAAWRAYQHEHHDRDRLKTEIAPIQTELRELLEHASPKKAPQPLAPRFANNLLKVWPALWTFVTIDGVEPTNNPAERSLRAPVIHRKTLARHAEPTTASDSPNAHSPPPAPAAYNTAHYSPTSTNYSSPTAAATRSPHSPKRPQELNAYRNVEFAGKRLSSTGLGGSSISAVFAD